MEALNAAFNAHEGCLVVGWLKLQRVAGNLHVSVHMDDYIMLERVYAPPHIQWLPKQPIGACQLTCQHLHCRLR